MADDQDQNQPTVQENEENRLVLLRDQRKELQAILDLQKDELKLANALSLTLSERQTFEENILRTKIRIEEIDLAIAGTNNEIKSIEDKIKVTGEKIEKAKKEIEKSTGKELENNKKNLKYLEGQLATQEKQLEEKRRDLNLDKIRNRLSATAQERAKGELSGIIKTLEPQAFQRIADIFKVINSSTGGIAKAFRVFAPLMFLEGMIKIFNAAKEADKRITDLNRTILSNRIIMSQFQDMATSTSELYDVATKYGLEIGDISKTLTGLYSENAAFLRYMEDNAGSALETTRSNAVKVAASLERNLNLSSAVIGNILDINRNLMGLDLSEATDFLDNLTESASEAGQTVPEFANRFVANYPKLRIYGDKAQKIFEDLNRSTYAVGANLETAFSIQQQFDTYESAAMASTQLNMLLGSNFDALAAMASDPKEIMDMVKQNLSASQLENMGFRQKQYLASLLGVEFSELERVIKGDEAPKRDGQKMIDQLSKITTLDQLMQASLSAIETYTGHMAAEAMSNEDGPSARSILDLGGKDKFSKNVQNLVHYAPGKLIEREFTSEELRMKRRIEELVSQASLKGSAEERKLFEDLMYRKTTIDEVLKANEGNEKEIKELMNFVKELRDGNLTNQNLVADFNRFLEQVTLNGIKIQ